MTEEEQMTLPMAVSLRPILLLLFLLFPACLSHAAHPLNSTGEATELWEGKVLTASFKVGMCFARDGKARGVLILTHRNGKNDVYHLYGSLKDKHFDLAHSSGHFFKGELTGPEEMKGKVKLSNGLRLTLKGRRTQNARLYGDDCSPVPNQER